MPPETEVQCIEKSKKRLQIINLNIVINFILEILPEDIWRIIISFLRVVDILDLSFSSRSFNVYCYQNKKIKKVKKLSNSLTNKDLYMQIFLSNYLDEFFMT